MSKPGGAFRDFVLDQLARVPALSSAPFFGGIGLRSGAAFFGMIMDGTLYFSTSPATRVEYEKRGSRCFSYVKQGKRLAMRAIQERAMLDRRVWRDYRFWGRTCKDALSLGAVRCGFRG
jgi:TfoX/Sxy family transcriptional regulator of competence genes